jgi:hypothetical protein
MCPAQQLNAGWEKQLSQMLEEFKACAPDAENGQNRCQQFTAQCFSTVYNVKDFYASADKRYMNLPEMVAYLQQSGKWTALGAGYDPKVLANAQTYANEGKAVVAVYMSEEQLGHASIILPGELKLSGTWGVKVPNSASFFTYNPTNSYLHKSLAYAYERANLGKVQLYVKNY